MSKNILKKVDKKQESKKQANKNSRGFLIFLAIVVGIYVVTYFIDSNLAIGSLTDALVNIKSIVPIFVFVFVVMFLNNIFLTPERIKKHFGKDAGVKGWFYAIIFGVIMAGPPYILYPMLKDMKKNGIRDAYLAVFLYNRNVKIPFIPAMIFYFGWQYTVVLSTLVMIFSVFNGVLIEKILKKE